MQRYKIKIEYEGTPFVGWQFQKNGQSIQEVIQKAIFKFSKEKVTVIGAGRTDSGVHALGQTAHFDLKKKISKKKILPAINQNIENNSVTVLKVNKTNKKFHARHDAKKRTYRYLIVNRQSPLALQKNKAWHIRKKLDLLSIRNEFAICSLNEFIDSNAFGSIALPFKVSFLPFDFIEISCIVVGIIFFSSKRSADPDFVPMIP